MKNALAPIALPVSLAFATIGATEAKAEPAADVYESSTYPIRVFSDDETLGNTALIEAEYAWEKQVVDMGFALPLRIVNGQIEEGFDMYLDPDTPAQALATFDILGDNPDTPATDCPTMGILNPDYMNDEDIRVMCVRHLLNHASLHAVDCLEPQMPTFDMFTVAVEILMDDNHPYWLSAYLPGFQELPFASLDYVVSQQEYVFYMFGSALFTLFLEEKYGQADGSLLVDIWARTPQNGTINWYNGEFCSADIENEPDFLDAVEEEMESLGKTMDEVLTSFTEWRYFVGADDDGSHFKKGSSWAGGEVVRDARISVSDLPVLLANVNNNVAEWGSSYIELDLKDLQDAKPMTFGFEGDSDTKWNAQLLLIPQSGAASTSQISLSDGFSGTSAGVGTGNLSKIVLAVSNLGDGTHDPEDSDWTTDNGSFSYSISFLTEIDAGADSGADSGDDSNCGCRIIASDVRKLSLLELLF